MNHKILIDKEVRKYIIENIAEEESDSSSNSSSNTSSDISFSSNPINEQKLNAD
jgi:hypothetical protein